MVDASAVLGEIAVLAKSYELGGLETAVDQICGCAATAHATHGGHGIEDEAALLKALEGMRNARAFPAIERLCNRLLKLGCGYPFLRRFYAQALIDRNNIPLAIDVLEQLKAALAATSPPDDPERHKSHREYAEAQGLLGRCYKQIYIDNVDAASPHTRRAVANASAGQFNNALNHYVSMVDLKDPTATDWHTVNVIAMMVRGRRDGLRDDFGPLIQSWANYIVNAYEPIAETTDNPWTLATLGEAQAALGNWKQASKWLARFAEHDRVDAFMLYGTIRQLEQLYSVKAGDESTDQVLTRLKHRLATISRGQVNFSRGERDSIAALENLSEQQLQARLGKEGPHQVKWLKRAFQVARSIARVRFKNQETEPGHGTGFLVKGSVLAPSLGDETFLLTNAHVIARRRDRTAITPGMATLTFDEVPGLVVACKEVVWSSPFDELDASLVRLDLAGTTLPGTIDPEAFEYFPGDFADLSPNRAKAYIIGHPEGGDLSISLDDADIVDLGRRRSDDNGVYVHYKTPTEHGSSGSPVFNADWRVVALHHAGPPRQANGRAQGLKRLGGRGGFHWANEGITLASIAAAVRKDIG